MIELLALFVVLVVVAGYVCGIVAVVQNVRRNRRLQDLENRVGRMSVFLASRHADWEAEAPQEPVRVVSNLPSQKGPQSAEQPRPDVASKTTGQLPPPLPGAAIPKKLGSKIEWAALELKLGTRWIIWLGAIMFLGGVAFALKYSYDNALIGPMGRLAIGVLSGVAGIAAGEWFRKKSWRIPFQAFTGAGFAIFYICIYFAFQVYGVTGQGMSMTLAVVVTALAVTVAVAHNALSIAILAVLGGYASPVLLSTGQNHPYVLFTYIAALNLVALGSAWFRRWRALDLVCFVGTAIIYQGWYVKFYEHPSQLIPAMLYTTLFYLMFLAAPSLYSLVRKMPEGVDGLTLITLNALFSVYCYYNVLFEPYRYALGFVVLGQAALVFLLFRTWSLRVDKGSRVAESLLIIALALVTLAIPIQLKLYGIPIAWAVEGALFVYLGLRFEKRSVLLGGCAALTLAVAGLLYRLPLHHEVFTPAFNRPFAAWLIVIVASGLAAYLLSRNRIEGDRWRSPLMIGAALMSFALTCLLLTMEVWLVWGIPREPYWRTHAASSLSVLWTVIPVVCCLLIRRKGIPRLVPLAWTTLGIGVAVFLYGVGTYRLESSIPVVNSVFLARLLLIVSLWWAVSVVERLRTSPVNAAFELIGHGQLALLAALELNRWSAHTDLLSKEMAFGIISAAWAIQGCVLVWYGLVTCCRYRRYAGFVLFGLATGKTILIDTFHLEAVYRIVSWLGSGALLVAAALLYQQYAPRLMGEKNVENNP